jgi:nicotinate-nucleotide adenylyltransferase
MQKIGIIGGTFNPIHIGHLIIADHFQNELGLNKCFFVPAWLSPFKTEDPAAQEIPAEHRVNMLRLAIEGNTYFDIDLFEIEKKGISYTYDTVQHFMARFPEAELFLYIGSDQAKSFTEWGNWEKIIKQTQLCIAARPESYSIDEKNVITKNLTVNGKSPYWLETPLLEISSSDIRERVISNKSIRYLVPEKVREYISVKRLYHSR